MPRIDKSAAVACPPLRLLCFDNLGLAKVVESTAEKQEPQVVARWGDPDPQRCVTAVSLSNEATPGLAVARKNKHVDILDPSNGRLLSQLKLEAVAGNDNAIIGVHLFRPDSSGTRSLLTCTEEGKATLQPVHSQFGLPQSNSNGSKEWQVCNSGNIICSKVDFGETHAIFGGKGVDVNLWSIEKCSKIWEAKPPRLAGDGLFLPPFVTASVFLSKEDHRKVVVGTGQHQVRLYDTSAQRKPVLCFDFRESPVKAIETDIDGFSIYLGNGMGDLASFDMRTGKMIGIFKGKCSGSIRSIAKHPELPIIATCGLDRFVRLFDTRTRKLCTRVFLKQQLLAVNFLNQSSSQPSLETVADSKKDGEKVLLAEGSQSEEGVDSAKKRKLAGKKKSKKKSKLRNESSGC